MSQTYTPLNLDEFKKKYTASPTKKEGLTVDVILLLIGILTALVLIFLLYTLIQKKAKSLSFSLTPYTYISHK